MMDGVADKSKMEEDHVKEDSDDDGADLEVMTFTRRFPKNLKTYVQNDWPMVNSALQEYGFSCSLNLVNCYMSFCTTRRRDPDIVDKARDLLHLMSIRVPASYAMRTLDGSHWDIIEFGYQKDGICSKFAISREQYLEQRKQLSFSSLKVLGSVMGCTICFCHDDWFVAAGPFGHVKLVRMIVEDCMVRKVPLVARIKYVQGFKMQRQVQKKLEVLRL